MLFPLFSHLFAMKWWDRMPWSQFSECWVFLSLVLFIYLFYFTILYWFCHTLTWIHHGCTCVPHPEPPLPPPSPSYPSESSQCTSPKTLYHASNLDWQFISHMVIYMLQCHSPISSCPRPLPQSPKDCSIHVSLFCCLTYRVSITIFLNSIYMRTAFWKRTGWLL